MSTTQTCATFSSVSVNGSYVCQPGLVCGYVTSEALWGCAPASLTGVPQTQDGAEIPPGTASFPLGCLGYSDFRYNCDEACQEFTSRLTCSVSTIPYCATFLLPFYNTLFAAYYCEPQTALEDGGGFQDIPGVGYQLSMTHAGPPLSQFVLDGASSIPAAAIPITSAGSAAASTTTTDPLAGISPPTIVPVQSGYGGPTSTTSSSTTLTTTTTPPATAPVNTQSTLLMTTSSPPSSSSSAVSVSSSLATSSAVSVNQSSSSGLSTGASAGIGAGVAVAGLALIGLIAFLIYRCRKRSKKSKERNYSYTLASNNPDYYNSPEPKTATTPYLDHPYTPQMHMQEMGANGTQAKEVPMSPNSEIMEKADGRFSNISGATRFSGMSNEPTGMRVRSMSPNDPRMAEMSGRSAKEGSNGLGIAELDTNGRR